MRRRCLIAIGVVVAMAGGLLGAVWTLQRSVIYAPDTAPVPPVSRHVADGRDVTVTTADGLGLGAWFLPEPEGQTGRGAAVLVAPGNAGNREGRLPLARALRAEGFAVLLLDYRGYGGNPGSPSEDGLATDADAAVATLTRLGYPPGRTIYLGESLGTGVVTGLATRTPPAGLVLRSPFPDLADVARTMIPFLPRSLIRDRYPVADQLARLDVPVSVIRGTDDTVIPPALSARVAEAAPRLHESAVFAGAGHNDPVMFGPRVAAVVARLADALDH